MNMKIIKAGIYHRAEVTTERSGRMSVVIYAGSRRLVDVELPDKTGTFKDAFKPCVTILNKEIEIEISKEG